MPTGRVFRMAGKRRFVRMLQREHLAEAVNPPPAMGEAVHIVENAKSDFATWIPQLIDWFGGRPADSLYCSTWTLARPNAQEVFALADAGLIASGQMHFLTGLYFKRREVATYTMLLDGLLRRCGKFRALEIHCKILLLACEAAGMWLTVEGSANLNANPRFEQYVLTNDRGLWEFHRGWMDEVFTSPPKQYRSTTTKSEAGFRGYSHRRAGLGVTTAANDIKSQRRIIGAKCNPIHDPALILDFAAEVAALIRHWLPTPPVGCIVTCPPQGASWPGEYYAAKLAAAVAEKIGLTFRAVIQRTDEKTRHGKQAALAQEPFVVPAQAGPIPAAIVVDDLITSGTTMKLSLAALAAAGVPVYGFAWHGA